MERLQNHFSSDEAAQKSLLSSVHDFAYAEQVANYLDLDPNKIGLVKQVMGNAPKLVNAYDLVNVDALLTKVSSDPQSTERLFELLSDTTFRVCPASFPLPAAVV